MLILRESHRVRGAREDEFEAAVRDAWLPALAQGDVARLLYFLHHAHGTGISYHAVTYTWLRAAAAWGRLAQRVDAGDLAPLQVELDELRYDVEAKLLVPLPWSPLQEIEIDAVPREPSDHALSLFMEDTIRPEPGRLEAYVEMAGRQYLKAYEESFPDTPRLLDIQATFRTAFGSHRRREATFLQKVLEPEGLLHPIREEMPAAFKEPGRYMRDALAVRDQWQSRLLRTARWSPWH